MVAQSPPRCSNDSSGSATRSCWGWAIRGPPRSGAGCASSSIRRAPSRRPTAATCARLRRWAELQGADSARVHEPLLPETDDESVQILTIHGAKGLEFPITILSGMTTQPGSARRGVSLVWGDDGRPEVAAAQGHRHRQPRAPVRPRARDGPAREAPAAVRGRHAARDHLIVSAHHKAETKQITYASRIWNYFVDQPELWRPLAVDAVEQLQLTEVIDAARPHPSIDDRDAWIERRDALLDDERRRHACVSATAVARSVDVELIDEDDDQADVVDDATVPVRRQGRAGTAIGRAVHASLQVLDLADPRDLDAQVGLQCDIESIPEHVGASRGAGPRRADLRGRTAGGRARRTTRSYTSPHRWVTASSRVMSTC